MKTKPLLLAITLIAVSQASIMANGWGAQGVTTIVDSKGRAQDGADRQRQVAGVFQRYDPSRKNVRISDVDYDLDPSLAQMGSKLRELRSGQAVLFTQSGVSVAGRNVLNSIEPQ